MELLLRKNDISKLTSLSGNIDIDKLNPFIHLAQATDVKRILGKDLYEKMFDANLTDEYLIIYDEYLVFILAYYATAYFIDFAGVQVNNNGIFKMDIENGKALELKEVQIIAEKYRKLALNFEAQLFAYLKTINIPEYQKATIHKRTIPWY